MGDERYGGGVKKSIPVACSLDHGSAVDQLAEWHALQADVLATERVPNGIRMRLSGELRDAVEDLARREQACCRFLSISIAVDGTEIVVDIVSDQLGAGPVIDLLAGLRNG